MTSHFCDSSWHAGKRVHADFLILPLPGERSMDVFNGFSCCQEHSGRALRLMLEKVKTVTVHVVNSETRADRI